MNLDGMRLSINYFPNISLASHFFSLQQISSEEHRKWFRPRIRQITINEWMPLPVFFCLVHGGGLYIVNIWIFVIIKPLAAGMSFFP